MQIEIDKCDLEVLLESAGHILAKGSQVVQPRFSVGEQLE